MRLDRRFPALSSDPLACVTDELRAWFELEPAFDRSRQLLERLQETYPGRYPTGKHAVTTAA